MLFIAVYGKWVVYKTLEYDLKKKKFEKMKKKKAKFSYTIPKHEQVKKMNPGGNK